MEYRKGKNMMLADALSRNGSLECNLIETNDNGGIEKAVMDYYIRFIYLKEIKMIWRVLEWPFRGIILNGYLTDV